MRFFIIVLVESFEEKVSCKWFHASSINKTPLTILIALNFRQPITSCERLWGEIISENKYA